MATYAGSKMASTIPPRAGINVVSVIGTLTLPGVALTTGDFITLCPIPLGAQVKQIVLDCGILDTGSGLTLQVGDTGAGITGGTTAARYVTNTLVTNAKMISLSANGFAGCLNAGRYTAQDIIQAKVLTGPQTGTTTGAISYLVEYTFDP